MRSMVEGAAAAPVSVALAACPSSKIEAAAAPSTTLRVVPLPRFTGEDHPPLSRAISASSQSRKRLILATPRRCSGATR